MGPCVPNSSAAAALGHRGTGPCAAVSRRTQGVHEDMHFGDVNLVSGIPWPTVTLDNEVVHFRFLVASVSRPYLLHIKDEYGNKVGQNYCVVSGPCICRSSGALLRYPPLAFTPPLHQVLHTVDSRACAQIVGSDGGYRNKAVTWPVGGLFLAVAERYQVRALLWWCVRRAAPLASAI